jgi:uncharacterized membrane-anchored protein YhcB (DUF1043 family)
MINKKGKIFFLVLLAVLFFPALVFSQSPSVQTFADKKDILIGEQVKLKIKTILPVQSGASGYSLFIPDSIQHFDIVDKGKADTVDYKDNSKAIEQTITLTSFDSGSWVFPSLDVRYAQADQQHFYKLQTDSIAINVSYSPPDSTNQLRDIKPIMEVNVANYTWYYIAGGFVILLILGYLVWRFLKKRKQNPRADVNLKLSPYDEAMQELAKLDQLNLNSAEDVKQYHSGLSDIFRRYNGRKQNKNLLNKTTGDILIEMKKNDLARENISMLATALRCSDAVKFARYIPLPTESKDCLVKIKETIHLIEQQTTNN